MSSAAEPSESVFIWVRVNNFLYNIYPFYTEDNAKPDHELYLLFGNKDIVVCALY